jgi:hypothetical protein
MDSTHRSHISAYITKGDLKIQRNPIKIPMTSTGIEEKRNSKIHVDHRIQTSLILSKQSTAESITIADFK